MHVHECPINLPKLELPATAGWNSLRPPAEHSLQLLQVAATQGFNVAFNTFLAKVCVLCDGLSGDRDPDTGAGERWIYIGAVERCKVSPFYVPTRCL
jgi:hypothetical protein